VRLVHGNPAESAEATEAKKPKGNIKRSLY
jgi:hypothetical protein